MTPLTRREFLHRAAILGLSASAAAMLYGCGIFPAPTPTPARIPKIGFLTTSKPVIAHLVLQDGLRELGYEDGKNITIVYRDAGGDVAQLPVIASELVALPVDIIVIAGQAPALPAKNATSTIPIVFLAVGNLIENGFIASFAHPGGNMTGPASNSTIVDGKRLQLLKETVTGLERVAVSRSPGADHIEWPEVQDAGKKLGLQLQLIEYQKPEDFEAASASVISSSHVQALFSIDAGNFVTASHIAEIAIRNRLPTSFKFREAVDEGGLMSYGLDTNAIYRRGAAYVDKILKGAKPGDLPVEQPTKFDFVINLRTAKELGLMIPQSVLAQATEVIQ